MQNRATNVEVGEDVIYPEFSSGEYIERLFALLEEPKEIKVIADVDQFFEDILTELVQAVSGFIVSATICFIDHIEPLEGNR